ncbi:uncharacterized protein LOC131673569 [Phymastichus coffea]|uniref:uncharacterized protein LOC131673569 n=1 Tax=Phymastichus coffea TaxID=108790 RepID=UPI00273B3619|nr:uncharacterized protein LOC131673569 [Phymastichus coffea]
MAAMNFDFEALPSIRCTGCATVQKSWKKQRVQLNDTVKDSLKGRYDAGVLVGNWFDRRADYKPPIDNWITSYDSSYICKTNWNLNKDRQASIDNKIKVERGLGSEFLIKYRGDHFQNNYTTTNDIFFRLYATDTCGPRARKFSSRKNIWLPEANLTDDFGNQTNLFPPEVTQTDACGCPKQTASQKRFPKPKGDMNTPQLCHLDIDPDQPFRRHLVKTK